MDIFALVYAFLDDMHAVLVIMRTCHKLWSLGALRLLEFPLCIELEPDHGQTVYVNQLLEYPHRCPLTESYWIGSVHLNSFCAFVSAHPSRALHLRHLAFSQLVHWSLCDQECLKEPLIDTLRHTQNLQALELYGIDGPRTKLSLILHALRHVTTIKSPYMTAPDSEVARVLTEWRSAVETVAMSFQEAPFPVDQANEDRCDPTWVLAAFQSSLRELTVTSPFLKPRDVVFPHVTKLSVSWLPRSGTALLLLFHAFSRLRELNLWGEDAFPAGGVGKLPGVRASNRVPLPDTWASLDCVQGTVIEVYVHSLRCRVRHMALYLYANHDGMRQAAAVLEDTQPERLELEIDCDLNEMAHLQAILQLSPTTITRLSLSCYLSERVLHMSPSETIVSCTSINCLTATQVFRRSAC